MAASAAQFEPPVIWKPHPGPQTRFLASSVFEILYGGQAGGGKSAALTVFPLRWVTQPSFYSVTVRREVPQLQDLLKKAWEIYPQAFPGCRYVDTPYPQFKFPAPGSKIAGAIRGPGAVVRFGQVKLERDYEKYQGQEIHLLNLDELTHFTKEQYRGLKSRVRSSVRGCPKFIRATSNPGGIGHEWVFDQWGPWLDPDFCDKNASIPERLHEDGERIPYADPEEILWYLRDEESDQDRYVQKGTSMVVKGDKGPIRLYAESRTFIPASIEDNPTLLEEDPQYLLHLLDNTKTRMRQLRYGDWLSKPAAGDYFQREWFDFVTEAPADTHWCRFWDRASTEKKKKSDDPDFTSGCLYGASPSTGLFFLRDLQVFRGEPGVVAKRIEATSEADAATLRNYRVGLEQEPGASGKFEVQAYIALLNRFQVEVFLPTGSKMVRAGVVSTQVQARNVKMFRGPWNKPFFEEAEGFPEWVHDDQVDSLSGAHLVLTSGQRPVSRGRLIPTA